MVQPEKRADLLLIRKYHRRNDIQPSILGSKCTTMYINENFHALHLRTQTYERLASSSQTTTTEPSPARSKTKAQDFARMKAKRPESSRRPSSSKTNDAASQTSESPNRTWISSSKGLWSKFLALFMISTKCGRRKKPEKESSNEDEEEEEELMKSLELSEYLEDFYDKPAASIAKLDEFEYSEDDL